MKTFAVKTVVFLIVFCLFMPVLTVFAENEVVALSLSCLDSAYVGGEIKVRITVSKPSVALAGLEFTLCYDPEFVSPKIVSNNGNESGMDQFIIASPEGWEQMSSHSEEESKYHLRFAMPFDKNSYLDTASELVLEIPFAVKAAGSFGFAIDSTEIIAVEADDKFSLRNGSGSELEIVASGEQEKISVVLGGNDTVSENRTYNLDIEVTNLGDPSGIIALEFALQYDKSAFSPVITQNSSAEMDKFMVSMPDDNWEQMCSLEQDDAKYILRFAALNVGSVEEEKLQSGESLIISVPFRVIAKEGAVAEFSVSATSIIGVNGVTGIVNGSGSYCSVSVEKPIESDYNQIISELGYKTENGYLLYVSEKTPIADFLAPFNSLYLENNGTKVESGNVATGYVLTNGEDFSLKVVVLGDVNGNGQVDAYDYALAKRAYLDTYSASEIEILAMAITNGKTITVYDYGLIKRHFLGTHNINA